MRDLGLISNCIKSESIFKGDKYRENITSSNKCVFMITNFQSLSLISVFLPFFLFVLELL